MECYEGIQVIKTFRGLIADGAQDTIVLHTNDGATGYRIVKFECIPNTPGTGSDVQAVVKIYKTSQTTIDDTVDFSDQTLLGCLYFQDNAVQTYPSSTDIIFDTEVFNQDIYITHEASAGSQAMNYYLELEQVKLDLSENTVATLKDIRNVKTQGL